MDEEFTPEEEEKEDKSISSDLIRGHINTIILRALYDGDKYGYEIIAEIERKSHGQYSLKQPSLYSALKRLEKDGYVTSYWGGSVGGGRRKYFSLTESGKEISEHNQSEWEYSRTVIDSLISDKDFDFSNPPPSMVDMRVLRSSTSRVPHEGEDEEDFAFEPEFDDPAKISRLEEEYAQKQTELESQYTERQTQLDAQYEQKRAELESQYEERQTRLGEEQSELDEKRRKFEEEMQARAAAMQGEQNWREKELAERERVIAEQRQQVEQLISEHRHDAEADQAMRAAEAAQESERRRILDEEAEARRQAFEAEEADRRRALDEEEASRRKLFEEETARRKQFEEEEARKLQQKEQELEERESFYNAERNRFAELLRQRDEQIEEERRAHAIALEEQQKRIIQEQEAEFRRREQQLLHQNYLDLVSTPPAPEGTDYTYYSAPLAEESPKPTPVEAAGGDYRAVVQNIYSTTVHSESAPQAEGADNARALDGIDFQDLESRAKRDGIRVTTAGGKFVRRTADTSSSLVNKGKALFLSAIVVFCLCIIEGSIVLGVQKKYALPLFYPYFIWCIGLAVLLITGLAYANRYGERSLRRTGPILINAFVTYALLIIVTLIVALAVRIDFTAIRDLAVFIIIPIVFFFGVVVFGICYYLLTKPQKESKS